MGAVEVTEFQVMAWTLPTEAGFYYMRDPSFIQILWKLEWKKGLDGIRNLLVKKLY